MAKAKPSELTPVDWEAMEPHFRAGLLTYKQLEARFGVTPAGIIKHFRKKGITRDLKERILAKARDKVNAAMVVSETVNAVTESAIVEAGSNIVAGVELAQREGSTFARENAMALLREVAATIQTPEVFGQIHAILVNPGEEDLPRLREFTEFVAGTPQRIKAYKDALEALDRAFLMERRSFGMDSDDGGANRFTVVVKDYTGRGSAEAPARPADEEEA